MYRTGNPFRKLLTPSGKIDLSACMTTAWRRYRETPWRYQFLARSNRAAFGNALKEVLENARIGVRNHHAAIREAQEEAELRATKLANAKAREAAAPYQWTEADYAELTFQCSTDGRLPERRLAA